MEDRGIRPTQNEQTTKQATCLTTMPLQGQRYLYRLTRLLHSEPPLDRQGIGFQYCTSSFVCPPSSDPPSRAYHRPSPKKKRTAISTVQQCYLIIYLPVTAVTAPTVFRQGLAASVTQQHTGPPGHNHQHPRNINRRQPLVDPSPGYQWPKSWRNTTGLKPPPAS